MIALMAVMVDKPRAGLRAVRGDPERAAEIVEDVLGVEPVKVVPAADTPAEDDYWIEFDAEAWAHIEAHFLDVAARVIHASVPGVGHVSCATIAPREATP